MLFYPEQRRVYPAYPELRGEPRTAVLIFASFQFRFSSFQSAGSPSRSPKPRGMLRRLKYFLFTLFASFQFRFSSFQSAAVRLCEFPVSIFEFPNHWSHHQTSMLRRLNYLIFTLFTKLPGWGAILPILELSAPAFSARNRLDEHGHRGHHHGRPSSGRHPRHRLRQHQLQPLQRPGLFRRRPAQSPASWSNSGSSSGNKPVTQALLPVRVPIRPAASAVTLSLPHATRRPSRSVRRVQTCAASPLAGSL